MYNPACTSLFPCTKMILDAAFLLGFSLFSLFLFINPITPIFSYLSRFTFKTAAWPRLKLCIRETDLLRGGKHYWQIIIILAPDSYDCGQGKIGQFFATSDFNVIFYPKFLYIYQAAGTPCGTLEHQILSHFVNGFNTF